MKRLIAILAVIGLMLMPLAISEEIEITDGIDVEDTFEETELNIDGEIEENLSEDIPVLDLGEDLLIGDEETGKSVATEANVIPNTEGVAINETNFPDENFRAYVLQECDNDKDGYLSNPEIEAVEEMFVSNKKILSLVGIEYFYDLKHLSCSDNMLMALDLRYNTKLIEINCDFNRLTWLNVSNCPFLTTLLCRDNQLTILDVRGNPKLGMLACTLNNLEELDLTNNPILIKAVREYGPILLEENQKQIRYIPKDAINDTDSPIMFERNIRVYANGQLLYSPDKPIQRTIKPVTLGVGETDSNLLFYKGEEADDTPYWLQVLSEDGRMTYESSDSRIVEVNNNKGLVKGIKTGKATIKVTSSKGVLVTCKVTVKKAPSSIYLSKSKMTIMEGRKKEIKVRLPSGSACRELRWSSSNPNVAEYNDYYSAISAYSPGQAVITVKTHNGKKATCKVTVTAPEPTTLTLNTTGLFLRVGETFQIVPEIDKGTATTFTYASRNKKVATVSSKGLVKGKKKGSTKITVKTKNGLKKSFEVQVGNTSSYKPGTSGVRVYASPSDAYYHTKSSCSKIIGSAERATLETALNYGKKPCHQCAASAMRTVYVGKDGIYYHYSKNHAGSEARKGTLDVALALGYDPCKTCVTRTE